MYLIGIDVGGMSIKGGIVDSESGKILIQHAIPTTENYTKDYSISEDIAKVIDYILEAGKLKIDDIVGIGIGQPGSIDSERGIVRYSNNIAIEAFVCLISAVADAYVSQQPRLPQLQGSPFT